MRLYLYLQAIERVPLSKRPTTLNCRLSSTTNTWGWDRRFEVAERTLGSKLIRAAGVTAAYEVRRPHLIRQRREAEILLTSASPGGLPVSTRTAKTARPQDDNRGEGRIVYKTTVMQQTLEKVERLSTR